MPLPLQSAPPRIRNPRPVLPSIPLEDFACVLLFAFFAMQGAIPGIAPAQDFAVTGAAPTSLATWGGIASQILVNGIILLLLLRRPRLLLSRLLTVPVACLFAGLAVASTAWSIDPLLTLRRSIPFALAGLFGLWFATRFSPRRQRAILHITFFLLAAATIAVVLLAPSIGLDHSPGHAADWQGVFTQKNACGRIMVLAAAVLLFGERLTAFRAAGLGLFLFIAVMSGSRGAWAVALALLLLRIATQIARRAGARVRTAMAVAAPSIVAALGITAVAFYPRIAPLIGRDPTVSGRTAIWAQVLQFIARRPIAGYGYNAFWRGMTGPSLQVSAAVHFVVEHAHNGLLEILLDLGLPGLILFLLSWIGGILRLWPLWRAGRIAELAFPLAALVLIALYSLDENTILIHNGIFWPLYVAALATAQNLASDRRHAAPCPARAILTAQSGEPAREEAESCPAP